MLPTECIHLLQLVRERCVNTVLGTCSPTIQPWQRLGGAFFFFILPIAYLALARAIATDWPRLRLLPSAIVRDQRGRVSWCYPLEKYGTHQAAPGKKGLSSHRGAVSA